MIRLLDLDDVLDLIMEVEGGEDELELRERIHPERATRALHRAARAHPDEPNFGELAAKAAALGLALVESGFIDDHELAALVGFLAIRLTVHRNGREWLRKSDDLENVRCLSDEHREITFARFATWVQGHVGEEIAEELFPDVHAHLSARISSLTSDQATELDVVADAVCEELAALSQTFPFKITPLDPRLFTWPTVNGEEVQGIEERLLLADGLISFGVGGGSFGAGEDRDFEAPAGMPILHLQEENTQMSPRDQSWLERINARIRYYPIDCGRDETEAVLSLLDSAGATVIVATHDPHVMAWCDDVLELRDATLQS